MGEENRDENNEHIGQGDGKIKVSWKEGRTGSEERH